MKKKTLYLVTTTTDDPWEVSLGNYLVVTESAVEAVKSVVEKTNQRVTAVVDVNEQMKTDKIIEVNPTVVE